MKSRFQIATPRYENDSTVRSWIQTLNQKMLEVGFVRSTELNQLNIDDVNNIVFPTFLGSESGKKLMLPISYDMSDSMQSTLPVRIRFYIGKWRYSAQTGTSKYASFFQVDIEVVTLNPTTNQVNQTVYRTSNPFGTLVSPTAARATGIASDTTELYPIVYNSGYDSVICHTEGYALIALNPSMIQSGGGTLSGNNYGQYSLFLCLSRSINNLGVPTGEYINIHMPVITATPAGSSRVLNTYCLPQNNVTTPTEYSTTTSLIPLNTNKQYNGKHILMPHFYMNSVPNIDKQNPMVFNMPLNAIGAMNEFTLQTPNGNRNFIVLTESLIPHNSNSTITAVLFE